MLHVQPNTVSKRSNDVAELLKVVSSVLHPTGRVCSGHGVCSIGAAVHELHLPYLPRASGSDISYPAWFKAEFWSQKKLGKF